MDGFLDRLYEMYIIIFVKGKKEQYEENFRLLRLAFANLLKTAVEYCSENSRLRYVFIVPNDWDIEMRELILRPLFIQAGLIEKEDHADRLQFFTKLECQVRLLQLPSSGQVASNFIAMTKSNRHCLIADISFASSFNQMEVAEEHTITAFEAVDLQISVGSLLGVKNWIVQKQALFNKKKCS